MMGNAASGAVANRCRAWLGSRLQYCLALVPLLGVCACNAADVPRHQNLPLRSARVVASYPHDERAFTQGLVYRDGLLYEGTGLYGRSSLSVRKLDDTAPLRTVALPPHLFGEGIAVVDERIVQLTWRARTGFVYDRATLRPLRSFSYDTEGWGLAYDGQRLIKSDGTASLEFMDPHTLQRLGACTVTASGKPVASLNELESVAGTLYANIWHSNHIARIDPVSCKVRDWIDLSEIAARFAGRADVLNGIAYDADGQRLFVTGKLWPELLHIEIEDEAGG
jgi:glutamine cyclotransferase